MVLCQWPVCPVGDTDGLSRQKEHHTHTHAKSPVGAETLPCCFSQEPLSCCCVCWFHEYTITNCEKHIVKEERGQSATVRQQPLLYH